GLAADDPGIEPADDMVAIHVAIEDIERHIQIGDEGRTGSRAGRLDAGEMQVELLRVGHVREPPRESRATRATAVIGHRAHGTAGGRAVLLEERRREAGHRTGEDDPDLETPAAVAAWF